MKVDKFQVELDCSVTIESLDNPPFTVPDDKLPCLAILSIKELGLSMQSIGAIPLKFIDQDDTKNSLSEVILRMFSDILRDKNTQVPALEEILPLLPPELREFFEEAQKEGRLKMTKNETNLKEDFACHHEEELNELQKKYDILSAKYDKLILKNMGITG
jgi:hypothetical protein